MNPKLMDRRVIILNPDVETENALGALVKTTQEVATVWASVVPLRGREYFEAQKIRSELSYRVTMRYRDDVTPAMTIRYKAKDLEINSVIEIGREEGLEIMCTEKRVPPNG